MLRRLIGIMLLLIGVLGVILSIIGVYYSDRLVNDLASGLNSTLVLTTDSLGTVEETLVLARTTMDDVNSGMETVEQTADNLAQTLSETRPLLDQISVVATEDVPGGIETMQATIPNMAEVAGVIDDTLTTLNDFQIDEEILGLQLQYDLGIDYQPTMPFDESVTALGSSLDGMPAQLRSLQPDIETASDNLEMVSEDLSLLADDLAVINGRIAEIDPLLADYIRIIGDIDGAVTTTRSQVDAQLDTVRLAIKVGLVWLGLMQLAFIYLGYDLLTGARDEDA